MTASLEKQSALLRVNGGRRILETRTGLTLYAACRTQQLHLPTGCGAQGRCALCRVRALGDLSPPTEVENTKIAPEDLAAGYRLACQARITGPSVEITIPDYAFNARDYTATVERIETLTHDIKGLTLALDTPIAFRAGQFLAFSSPPYPGQRLVGTRAYSLASPPSCNNTVDLVIRRIPGGVVTGWVFDHMKVGDTVKLSGPFGDFHITEGDRPGVMIAGGSGLSPFLAMLADLAEKGTQRKMTLFFGAVNPDDLYYGERFRAFEKEHDWFRFLPALSGNGTDHPYERGLITEVVERLAGDLSGSDAYLCGSPGMIAACGSTLARLHLPPDRLFYDRFA